MTTLLPKDADNNIIPALRLRPNGAHALASTTGAAVRNSTAFGDDIKIISLFSSVPMFIEFGDGAVTATVSSHYFPAGVYYDVAITGGSGNGPHHSHISVLAADEDGTLYISEKE